MSPKTREPAPARLLFEVDPVFNDLYDRGLQLTTTPPAGRRRERFYNLVQLFRQTLSLEGAAAECGCWNGLSSFLMCHYAFLHDPSQEGEGYHIFDSFEGLSSPTKEDSLSEATQADLTRKFGSVAGAFAATLEKVQAALSEFPKITYHKGWIPQVFEQIPELKYKFVHIDTDLYEPTRGSLEYFYPRMIEGGLIVCDDYGSLLWAGPRRAVDEFCRTQQSVPTLYLSTGQAVIWKKTAR